MCVCVCLQARDLLTPSPLGKVFLDSLLAVRSGKLDGGVSLYTRASARAHTHTHTHTAATRTYIVS